MSTIAKRKGLRRPGAKLNAEQEAFCQHYALNKCGADAVRHAYPQWKHRENQAVAVRASQILALRKIRERIAELEKKLAEKLERTFGITADWVLQRLAAIAAASLEHFLVVDERGHPSISLAKA